VNIDGVEISADNITQDLLELLVGERWPNGDEGAMRALSSVWKDAATQLDQIRQTASAAARQVSEYCQGANGDSFQSFWSAGFDDGQTSWPSGVAPAAMPFAVQFCKSMGDALNAGANQIETTKDTIMGNIAILVATVAPQIAAGFFDFGATDATAVAEVMADRTAMQVILDGAKTLITEVVEQAIEQGLMQAELNFTIQLKEVAEGHASSIDWSQVGSSGLSGAEGGALGAGFGFGLGKVGGKVFGEGFGKSFASRAATGVAAGALTNASLDFIQTGHISASDFAKGSLAGVLGGMGGAEAAAGDHPAIDTEHLPTELTTQQTMPTSTETSAATGAGVSTHTDLSGLTVPGVDAGTGAATANVTAPGSTDASAIGVHADSGGGVSFDASQATTATSSIAQLLGGGRTQDAAVGGGGAARADVRVGGGETGSGMGTSPSFGGTRAAEAMPASARSDVGGTSVSAATSVRAEANAESRSGSSIGADTGLSAAGGGPSSGRYYGSTRSEAGLDSAATAPQAGDRSTAPSGELSGTSRPTSDLTAPRDVVSKVADSSTLDSRSVDQGATKPADASVTDPSAQASSPEAASSQPASTVRQQDSVANERVPPERAAVEDSATQPQGSREAAVATAPTETAHPTESAGVTVTADDSGYRDPQSSGTGSDTSTRTGSATDGSTADGSRPASTSSDHTGQPSDPSTAVYAAEPISATHDGSQSDAAASQPSASTRPDAVARPDAGTRPDAVARSDAGTRQDSVTTHTDTPKPDTAQPDTGAKPDSARPDPSKPDVADPNTPGNGADQGRHQATGSQDGTGRQDASNGPTPDPNPGSAAVLITGSHVDRMPDAGPEPSAWAAPVGSGGLSNRLSEVNSRAEAGDRGISLFADPKMADLARGVEPDPNGAFDLNLHGDATGGMSGLDRLTPQDVLDLANANGHQPGQPFRLTACEAGALDHGFAAELSRISGCKVVAADSLVWTDSAGHMFASRSHTDGFGESVPDIPPTGHWVEFSPDGTRLPVGENGFPPGQESGFGSWQSPVGDVRSRGAGDPTEAARVTLDQVRSEWPELDRALTDNPVARDSLLSHPESVTMLDASLRDVQGRLDAAGIADAVRGGEITPEVRAKVDSIIEGLRAQDPNQVLDRTAQLDVSREIAQGTTREGYRQSGFDVSRREDPAYQAECVDRLREQAPQAQERLNQVVSDIAAGNGGEASWRPQVKDRVRALAKVREYVEKFDDGDAAMLVDVVGAKIRFNSVDELYHALDALKSDPRLEIVRIKDRVAQATESGNRSILMNVRLADGQVAELKFGLKSFEAPASAEHPLYEVRRDLDSIALAEQRPLTPVESLIKASTEAHARAEYGAAWNREMAVSRLHEVLTDHSDVASITQRLVADSPVHPTNVAKALADPATRDATIGAIGKLAEGQALGGRPLDQYLAENPGRGTLFEPVDPSINTTADGRDRKAVLVEEAKLADPARGVGADPTPEQSAQLADYATRLREQVHPAVEAEVRRLAEQVGNGASVSVRTKSADGILDKVERMSTGSPSRPGRPDYRAGDVIDAVGARITVSDMRDLAQALEAVKSTFGVGDAGRILEIDNMYATPKSKNPAYRVIPLVVRTEVDGAPYTFELQLTTRRASIAADLEHNTLFKPYVEMSTAEKATVRQMLAEAAALDQEETR
jgi:ppGpp synthetase/RelA/SpoT-type nucleotidyltranferase